MVPSLRQESYDARVPSHNWGWHLKVVTMRTFLSVLRCSTFASSWVRHRRILRYFGSIVPRFEQRRVGKLGISILSAFPLPMYHSTLPHRGERAARTRSASKNSIAPERDATGKKRMAKEPIDYLTRFYLRVHPDLFNAAPATPVVSSSSSPSSSPAFVNSTLSNPMDPLSFSLPEMQRTMQ